MELSFLDEYDKIMAEKGTGLAAIKPPSQRMDSSGYMVSPVESGDISQAATPAPVTYTPAMLAPAQPQLPPIPQEEEELSFVKEAKTISERKAFAEKYKIPEKPPTLEDHLLALGRGTVNILTTAAEGEELTARFAENPFGLKTLLRKRLGIPLESMETEGLATDAVANTIAKNIMPFGGIISPLGEMAPAKKKIARKVKKYTQSLEDWYTEQMTPSGQRPEGLAAKTTMAIAESAPGLVAMAIPSSKITQGARAVGTAKNVARYLSAKGIAPLSAKAAGEFIETGVPAGVVEGVFSALQNAAQTGAEIEDMPIGQLETHPQYQKAFATLDPSLPLELRQNQAREKVSEEAEAMVFGITAPWTAFAGMATGGGVLGKLAAGKGPKGAIVEILETMAKEGGQEFVQSGGEQFIQNLVARNYYDVERTLGEGVKEASVVGLLSGTALGGLGGGVSQISRVTMPQEELLEPPKIEPPPTPKPPAEPAATEPKAPAEIGRDAEFKAIFEAHRPLIETGIPEDDIVELVKLRTRGDEKAYENYLAQMLADQEQRLAAAKKATGLEAAITPEAKPEAQPPVEAVIEPPSVSEVPSEGVKAEEAVTPIGETPITPVAGETPVTPVTLPEPPPRRVLIPKREKPVVAEAAEVPVVEPPPAGRIRKSLLAMKPKEVPSAIPTDRAEPIPESVRPEVQREAGETILRDTGIQEAAKAEEIIPAAKPPELMTPEEYVEENWKRVGNKQELEASEISEQEKMWKDEWYKQVRGLPRDAAISFEALNSLAQGDREEILRTNDNALKTWAENTGWATKKYKQVLKDTSVRLTGELAGMHRKAINRALVDKSPVTTDAVDAYGIKLPDGYVRQGDRYLFRPSAAKPKPSLIPKKQKPISVPAKEPTTQGGAVRPTEPAQKGLIQKAPPISPEPEQPEPARTTPTVPTVSRKAEAVPAIEPAKPVKKPLAKKKAKPVEKAAPVPEVIERNLEEQLNAGEKIKPPKGATVLRVTDANGKQSVITTKNLDTLKGAGPFQKAEWGVKGKTGFRPMLQAARAEAELPAENDTVARIHELRSQFDEKQSDAQEAVEQSQDETREGTERIRLSDSIRRQRQVRSILDYVPDRQRLADIQNDEQSRIISLGRALIARGKAQGLRDVVFVRGVDPSIGAILLDGVAYINMDSTGNYDMFVDHEAAHYAYSYPENGLLQIGNAIDVQSNAASEFRIIYERDTGMRLNDAELREEMAIEIATGRVRQENVNLMDAITDRVAVIRGVESYYGAEPSRAGPLTEAVKMARGEAAEEPVGPVPEKLRPLLDALISNERALRGIVPMDHEGVPNLGVMRETMMEAGVLISFDAALADLKTATREMRKGLPLRAPIETVDVGSKAIIKKMENVRLAIKRVQEAAYMEGSKDTVEAMRKVARAVVDALYPSGRIGGRPIPGKIVPALLKIKSPEIDGGKSLVAAQSAIDDAVEEWLSRSFRQQIKNRLKAAITSPSIKIEYQKMLQGIADKILFHEPSPAKIQKAQDKLKEMIEARKAGKAFDMSKPVRDLLKVLNAKPLAEFTSEELSTMLYQIDQLAKIGRMELKTQNAYRQAVEQMRLEDIDNPNTRKLQTEYERDVASELKPPVLKKESKDLLAQARDELMRNKYYFMQIDMVIEAIDGFQHGMGPVSKLFQHNIQMKHNLFLNHTLPISEKLGEILGAEKLKPYQIKRVGTYLAHNQFGGDEKLALLKLTPEDIAEAVNLTPGEQRLADFIKSEFVKPRPELHRVLQETWNTDFREVDNYYSFLTDMTMAKDDPDALDYMMESMTGNLRKNVADGFIKERRVHGKQYIQLDAVEVFMRRIQDMYWMIDMGPTIKELQELATKERFGELVGNFGRLYLREYLDTAARRGGAGGVQTMPKLDWARRQVGLSTLMFKVTSMMVQFAAMFDAVPILGERWVTLGILKSADAKNRRFVFGNMPEIKSRVGDDPSHNEFSRWRTLRELQKFGMSFMQKADRLTAIQIGLGAYYKYMHDNGKKVDLDNPDPEGIFYAQKMVNKVLSSGSFLHAPLGITRGKLFGNKSITKSFTQFQTPTYNRFYLLMQEGFGYALKRGEYRRLARIMFYMNMANLFEAGLWLGWRSLWRDDEDDDKDKEGTAEKVFWHMMWNAISSIPIMGPMISAVRYDSLPLPAAEVVQNIGNESKLLVTSKKPVTKWKHGLIGAAELTKLGGVGGVPNLLKYGAYQIDTTTTERQKIIKGKLLMVPKKNPSMAQLGNAYNASWREAKAKDGTIKESGFRQSFDAVVEKKYGEDVLQKWRDYK